MNKFYVRLKYCSQNHIKSHKLLKQLKQSYYYFILKQLCSFYFIFLFQIKNGIEKKLSSNIKVS